VAGVALTALGWLWWRGWVWSALRLFAWQAWHLVTSSFTLGGRRGTYGTGLALVAQLGLAGAAAVCVAGVALGDVDLHFARQAWHLATWTFTLRGRRGAYGAGLALVARLGLVRTAGGMCGTW